MTTYLFESMRLLAPPGTILRWTPGLLDLRFGFSPEHFNEGRELNANQRFSEILRKLNAYYSEYIQKK